MRSNSLMSSPAGTGSDGKRRSSTVRNGLLAVETLRFQLDAGAVELLVPAPQPVHRAVAGQEHRASLIVFVLPDREVVSPLRDPASDDITDEQPGQAAIGVPPELHRL